MIYYDTLGIYVQSATTLRDKLIRINQAIDTLYTSQLNSALNSDISEYSMDSGQSRVKITYRDPEAIGRAINVLETQKQTVLNQLNGRITRHVDSRNINRRRNGY